ncbi:hypothetical protein ACHQM5_021783 [Ranunculus cassubicifolius]
METPSKVFRGEFAEIWHRELGGSSNSKKFTRRISGSEGILKHVGLYGKLNGHNGCVNTVSFNSTGDFVVSGSDDTQVIFWDWTNKTKKFTYHSGHTDNIFDAKIMPFTDDRVISFLARTVRLGQIKENGKIDTKLLGEHHGGVHDLAIEPGSPHIFYSCAEDAFVQHFDLRSHSATKLFWCSRLTKHKYRRGNIRLNAIVIDPRNPNYFSVGGYDGVARVYDIRHCQLDPSSLQDNPVNTFCPNHLLGNEEVNITGLDYSNTSELLVSYNDELVYLFNKNMGLGPNPYSAPPGDLLKLDTPQVYTGHRNARTVKGVSFFGPSDEFVMSGSDCGNIFIWRKKGGELLRLMAGDRHIVNCLESHPFLPVIVSSGIEKNVKVWSPVVNAGVSIPENKQWILEANRQGREDRSRVALTPDVILHVLRLQRQQPLAGYSRYTSSDIESDEEEGEDYIIGANSDGDATSSEDGDPRECNIS